MTLVAAESSNASFALRVRNSLVGWVDPLLIEWTQAAAKAFEVQLTKAGGSCHRQIAAPLASWLEMPEGEWAGLGVALDLLQVAFDMADNLADKDEDRMLGRDYEPLYSTIPTAVRMCLPAYLVATSRRQLDRTFSHRKDALHDASGLLHEILGAMVIGQGTEDLDRKAQLVSGAQAKLLCLPVWLCRPHPAVDESVQGALLAWAEAWGTTWELRFAYQERQTAAAYASWRASLEKARTCWPRFGPFAPGGALAPEAQLPGLC